MTVLKGFLRVAFLLVSICVYKLAGIRVGRIYRDIYSLDSRQRIGYAVNQVCVVAHVALVYGRVDVAAHELLEALYNLGQALDLWIHARRLITADIE